MKFTCQGSIELQVGRPEISAVNHCVFPVLFPVVINPEVVPFSIIHGIKGHVCMKFPRISAGIPSVEIIYPVRYIRTLLYLCQEDPASYGVYLAAVDEKRISFPHRLIIQ